jgi:protein SCO1/2
MRHRSPARSRAAQRALALLALAACGPRLPPPPPVGPDGVQAAVPRPARAFPNPTLITHEGQQVRFYDDVLQDRASVVVFFYTRCTGVCPTTIRQTAALREALRGQLPGEPLQFVAVTLDPELDSPAALAAYRAEQGIDEDPTLAPWTFLTGSPADLEVVRRGMGAWDPDPLVDADRTQHANLLTFGDDRTDRWTALPIGMSDERILQTLRRFVGTDEAARLADVRPHPTSPVPPVALERP